MTASVLARARADAAAGAWERALDAVHPALTGAHGSTEALAIAANAALALRRDPLALTLLQTLLERQPTLDSARRNLSRVHNRLALAAKASNASNASNTSNTSNTSNISNTSIDINTAERHWQQALTIWPGHHEARFNLAEWYRERGHWQSAQKHYQTLFADAPSDAEVRIGLAETSAALGAADDAIALWPPRLAAADPLLSRWRQLALDLRRWELWQRTLPTTLPITDLTALTRNALAQLADPEDLPQRRAVLDGIASRSPIGRYAPSLQLAITALLSLPTVVTSRDQMQAARRHFELGLDQIIATWTSARLAQCEGRLAQLCASNFLLAYQGQNDRELQSRYGDWLALAARTLRPDLATPLPRRKPGPPRVGLISGNWYDCTVGHYFQSWISAFQRQHWNTQVIALAPRIDAFSEQLRTQCTALHVLADDVDAAAEAIRALDLDLAIYPEIGMDTRLLPLAALPLARRQWQAWGHPVTGGLPTIDGYLSCAEMEPADAVDHYRERLHLLPGLGTRYVLPSVPTRCPRPSLGLPAGRLLVVPQSAFKIHPDNDPLIQQILAAVPDAQLLLFDSERKADSERLRARLGGGKRLHFLPTTSRQHFLQILSAADLMLDTLHWSGGNTSLDALCAGLPIVTCRGRFMRGRQTAAMLAACGMETAIASDAAQLVTLACERLQCTGHRPEPDGERLRAYAQSDAAGQVLASLAEQMLGGVL